MTALYEYRIFLDSLPASLTEAAAAPHGDQPSSKETYIVPRHREGCNLKIRDQRLELKTLVGRVDSLEQWQPIAAFDFPITRARLIDDVLRRIGAASPALTHSDYSASRLLYQVVVPSDDLDLCEVAKRRIKWSIDGCTAEIAEVELGRLWRAASFALEAKSPGPVLDVARRLGITDYPNQSYPSLIRSLMGLTPPAADASA